jgi:hypothetical protein
VINSDQLWRGFLCSCGALWLATRLSILQPNLGGFCNQPLVRNRMLYITSMGGIESSAKKFMIILFWEKKSGKLCNPSELYFCTWKNFPTEESRPADTCNCLSGQKWVASLTSVHDHNHHYANMTNVVRHSCGLSKTNVFTWILFPTSKSTDSVH